MLEEKNDNLQEADGNLTTDSIFNNSRNASITETQNQKQLLLLIQLF
jgi:hypothetical protein